MANTPKKVKDPTEDALAAIQEALNSGDEPARAAIEEQDRAISEKSGLPPLAIKTIRRSGK